jgi:carbonic anhydrase
VRTLAPLFENNRRWAEAVEREQPGFFAALARQQSPDLLWIGCSDSRVPANQIIGLAPGEVFVHRNVANVLAHSDLNALSVLQYAVEVLKVGHVVVCGHYGCGGVQAALSEQRLGLIDNWLLHVKDVRWKHRAQLDALDDEARFRRLCELNVIEQAANVAATPIAREAWGRGQALSVHGWIYDLRDGRLRDLGVTATSAETFAPLYESAVGPRPL